MKRVLVLATLLLGALILRPAVTAQGGLMPTARDFPFAGGNLANQRYSTLNEITPANISRLGGAWTIHLSDGEPGRNMQATPVVVDGVMYLGASGDVLAINAATGAILWRYKSTFGIQNNRGVAVAEGRVFTGQAGSRLVALDQKTGALVWETKVYDGARGGGTPGATLYSDGRVFVGVAGGEAGVRGQFGAYDAKTGKELWKFYMVPGPGEFGHDTWEGDSWTRGGGPLWTHAAIDPELGMVYVPAGNAAPDQDGSVRGGDNLFTVSIIALDVKSGTRTWHFQEVRHDLWDYDNPLPPVLADIQYRGRPRKLLIHGGKTGMTYILDRTNGTPLIGIEDRPVPQMPANRTAKTQPWPLGDTPVPMCPEPGSVAAGAISSCVFGAFRPELPVVMTPGTQGGLNWAPVTFSRQTNLFYVPGSLINSQFDRGFGRPAGQPRAGTLTAMDPATNKIVWQIRTRFPLATGAGLLSTASGLLFSGQSDGNLVVYDIRDGSELWRFQTGAGADAPIATYGVNGERYVAILSGGNSFQLSAQGDSLWAFKLGGKVPPAVAPAEPPTVQPGGGRRGAPPLADEGAPAAAGQRAGGAPPGGRGAGRGAPAPGGRGAAAGLTIVEKTYAATFSVTSTADSGPGSLRQAIMDSGRTQGPNLIEIDLPAGASPAVIAPTGQFLPPLKGPVTVRVKTAAAPAAGAIASGAASRPAVVLDGSKLVKSRTPEACPGATVAYNTQTNQWESSRVTGSGPNVRGYFGAGLAVHDTGHVEISGFEIRNFCTGIAVVRSHDVYIHEMRIVDSHGAAGVIFTGDDGNAAATSLSYNNMLLDSVLLDNGNGVELTRGARDSILQGNTIALTQPLPSDGNAVEFAQAGDNNAIMGNTFTKYVSTAVTVGGANQTIRDNTFLANAGEGMRASGTNLLILGNTFSDNGGDAISVGGSATRVIDNVISGNAGRGIVVGGVGITLARNSIYGNGRLGIDAGGRATAPGESAPARAAVAAPVVLPNAPVIDASSSWTAIELVLRGSLTAKPNEKYQVQLFISREADRHAGDERGWGDGEKYIGTAQAIADGSGKATFRLALKVPDIFGDGRSTGFVTATATDAAGTTSKFSRALPLTRALR